MHFPISAFMEAEACDEIQGYLIGPPLPAAEARRLIGETPQRRQSVALAGNARNSDVRNMREYLVHKLMQK
jgi:hypothetical protein